MLTLEIFLGVALVSLIVLTLTATLEKRLVWPYVPEGQALPGQLPPPNPYASGVAAAALAAGFLWAGTFADGKGKIYRLRYDFFRSPTGDVLALIGTGSIASLSLQTTWLYTLLGDGRCLVTVDSQNGGEIDLAGVTEEALVENRGFDGLLSAHQGRIAGAGRRVEAFGQSNPLNDFQTYRQSRVERLVVLGYAAFPDPGTGVWHYTFKGALTLAFRQYFTGLRRVFFPDKVRSQVPPLR